MHKPHINTHTRSLYFLTLAFASQGLLWHRSRFNQHPMVHLLGHAFFRGRATNAGVTISDRLPGAPSLRVLCPHHCLLRGPSVLCERDASRGGSSRFVNGVTCARVHVPTAVMASAVRMAVRGCCVWRPCVLCCGGVVLCRLERTKYILSCNNL